jgi:methionyl-tRNA synthetase
VGFVPCDHEYLNFKGAKLSKSRGAAVDVPYFLSKYDPDPLRFYLTATVPETRDTEFSWEDFVERNNPVRSANEGNELVATWGNLATHPRRGWPTACSALPTSASMARYRSRASWTTRTGHSWRRSRLDSRR